jgi:Na+/H+ antiporter NhaD/arsenite permease-like protein
MVFVFEVPGVAMFVLPMPAARALPPRVLALTLTLTPALGLLGPAAVRADDEPATTSPTTSAAPDSTATEAPAEPSGHEAAHPVPHWAWSLPFVALLLMIATLPLVRATHHWWENNLTKLLVGLVLGLTVLLYYGIRPFGFHEAAPGEATVLAVLRHAVLEDYVPFITLLFSLYVIAGGLQLRGDLLALPRVNTGFLALGAVVASFVGTTGASMILIRPLLQTNRDRTRVVHTVVFFIFLVSNIGGCLLPIGDPPLFLGYLKGVPFFWTLSLVVPWAFCVVSLLVVYYLWDRFYAFPREPRPTMAAEVQHASPLRLHGKVNLTYLAGVVAAVVLIVPGKPLLGSGPVVGEFVREAIMLGLAALSLATTPRGLRAEVRFDYGAIAEVAALFLGIFLTMQVPIEILRAHGPSLPLREPWQYFWATGTLSSFLDNAPTYLVFFETAKSLPIPQGAHLDLIHGEPIGLALLRAISLGAVFMGANTYIGNGPNFMVKSIAEGHGIKMPGFFGYMLYSLAILVPLFVVVTLLFFS